MAELYVNDPGTTLSSGCGTSDSTINLTSTTGYPGTGNFRIRVDNELMMVTNVSGLTWSVTRGIESTTAAIHSNGAVVNAVLTAAGLAALLVSNQYTTTFTSQTTLTVTHNLNSQNVVWALWDTSSPPIAITPSQCVATTANILTFTFGAATSGSVVVIS
jgi:hypothetical protein